MGNNDILISDDDVADMLTAEAKDCSFRYSAMGLEAFRPTTKKPANMPKPNTRFLRHIIRDTNSHNAALLAREAAESRARLDDLERAEAEEQARLRSRNRPDHIRKRQLGDINAILTTKVTSKKAPCNTTEKQDTGGNDEISHLGGRHSISDEHARPSRDRDSATRGASKRRSRWDREDDRNDARRKRRRRSSSQENATNSEDNHHRARKRRRSRRRETHKPERDGSDTRTRQQPHSDDRRSSWLETDSRHGGTVRLGITTSSNDTHADEDDPLDEFVGPAPPPKIRGRGAISSSSGIDRRFAEDYDPVADVAVDGDGGGDDGARGDWSDALEALRDRLEWKRHREERMRQAGFGDTMIEKLKGANVSTDARGCHGREQQDSEDFRWAKPGERREWDMGKDERS